MASLSESSSIHSIQDEEKISFVGYINSALKDDPDLQGTLPLNPSDNSLFSSVGTGVLLGKLINVVAPGTVDWNKMKTRTVQKFNQIENLNTVLDAAKRIGCNIVNMSAEDIIAGKAHLVCGLVWQILKNGLEIKMSAAMHVQRSSANDYQDVVIEWLNSNLRSTGCDRVVKNFTSDLSDSVALTYLCNRIFPDAVSLDLLKTSDSTARAEALVAQLEKAGVKRFISVNSITHGISKLNFAFLAELLAYRPGEARPGRPTVLRGSRIFPSGILASGTKLKDLDAKLTLSDTEALRRHTASPHETSTEKLRALEMEMSAQSKRLQESESQAQAARDELAKLRQENEALRQRNAVLEEEARAAKAGAAAESAKSSPAAPASGADNKAQVTALETELQNAKATVAELEARVTERANLLSALDVLEAKFDEVSKSREKLQDRVRELEKERRSLKKGVKKDESHSDTASKPKTGFAQEALDRQLAVIAARNAELEQKLKMYQTEELLRMRTDSEYIKFPVKEFKGNCKRSAFLMKQSKNGKKWKKRFFILKDNYLFYWKSNKDTDKHAKFMRLNGTTVEADNDKKAVLSVAGHGRRLVLQAEDERSGAEWVSTLRDVLRTLPVPTEDVSPAGRRSQRYSTLQRIKQGFRGKEEKKKEDDKKTSPEKEKGALVKTESSPAVVGVVKPAAAATAPPAAAAPVAADSTDTSSSSS